MKVFTAQQIRDWDKYTIEREPISSLQLMERAAIQIFKSIAMELNKVSCSVIICGTGNNGGDGLALARLIHGSGKPVLVFLIGTGKELSADCSENLKRAEDKGLVVHRIDDVAQFPSIDRNALVIDALLGSGTNRPAEGILARVIKWLNQQRLKVYSVDVPSGMQMDKFAQAEPQHVIKAHTTFSFQVIKKAFLDADNQAFTGNIELLDIGLDFNYYRQTPSEIHFLSERSSLPKLSPRRLNAEKRDFGVALLMAGSKGMMGAAVLAARSCAKSGAGLTIAYVPHGGLDIMQNGVPEATAWCDAEEHFLSRLPERLERATAVAIGPGLAKNRKTAELVRACLEQIKVPLVLDADALNIIAENTWQSLIPKNALITPHNREFERLFGTAADADKNLDLQLEASKEYGIYILRKGAYSKLTTPDGHTLINSTGNPAQAKGGSGDMLTGCILGLLARTGSIETAAVLGMYLHGLAADLALQNNHDESLLTSDCINMLPKAFHALNAI